MDIIKEAKQEEPALVTHRRHLHAYPELSGEETETLAYISACLKEYGIPHITIENGGILAMIDSGKAGKTVLLRADMDALPINEAENNAGGKPKVCVSKHAGVQHACGHDAHVAMLLSAAKLLYEHKQDFVGKVLCCFEQGEEDHGNIFYLLRYFEEHAITYDSCFGIHVGASKEDIPGKLMLKEGPFMAGMTSFDITIKGQGGHGARPDQSHSPIDCFCALYPMIAQLRMKEIAPFEPLTYSIGMVNAGQKGNVIPDELRFAGTVRYYNYEKAGEPFYNAMMKIITETASLYHCSVVVNDMHIPGYPVINNPLCTNIAREALLKLFPDDVEESEPALITESFSLYQLFAPGVYINLGVTNREKGMTAKIHTAQMEVDEDTLYRGVCAHVAYALAFLNHTGEIPFMRGVTDVKELLRKCGKTI